MMRTTTIRLARGRIILGVLLECVGMYNMVTFQSSAGMIGIGFTIIGALLGVPSTMTWFYAKDRRDDSLDPEKVALETLARLHKRDQDNSQIK